MEIIRKGRRGKERKNVKGYRERREGEGRERKVERGQRKGRESPSSLVTPLCRSPITNYFPYFAI